MKKLFFHLLDLPILNSYILHSSCGGKKISHRDFQHTHVRNMLAYGGPERRLPTPLGRQHNVELHIARLEVYRSKHWPTQPGKQLRCRLCQAGGVTTVCETNMLQRLPHQGTIVKTSATSLRKIWASRWYVSKRNSKFSLFHTIIMYNYKLKILTSFLNIRTNISVVSQKMLFNSLFNLVWFP